MSRQGQSRQNTPRKESGFANVFDVSLGMSKAPAVSLYNYHHVDLNAGSGWNRNPDCPGSPLVFLGRAADAGRPGPVHVYFCDIDPTAVEELRRRTFGAVCELPPGSTVHAACRDNALFLPEVAALVRERERRPELALGTCLCDPNAFREGFPVDALGAFFGEFARIDCVLNLNVRVLRCALGAKEAWVADPGNVRPCFKGFLGWESLADTLARFNKRYWFIRNPAPTSGDHFSTLVGRNRETKRAPFNGFFPLDSREGQEILRTLSHVEVGQKLLFE